MWLVPAAKRGRSKGDIASMIDRHEIIYTHATTPSEYDMWFEFARDSLANCTSWINASSAVYRDVLIRLLGGRIGELVHMEFVYIIS
jgi:hypothetical protein